MTLLLNLSMSSYPAELDIFLSNTVGRVVGTSGYL